MASHRKEEEARGVWEGADRPEALAFSFKWIKGESFTNKVETDTCTAYGQEFCWCMRRAQRGQTVLNFSYA